MPELKIGEKYLKEWESSIWVKKVDKNNQVYFSKEKRLYIKEKKDIPKERDPKEREVQKPDVLDEFL